jgi:hypothetical protein
MELPYYDCPTPRECAYYSSARFSKVPEEANP